MNKLISLTLTLLINSNVALASTISWVTFDYPPVFINKGKYRHQGFGDRHAKELKRCMNKYSHNQYDGLTFPRISKLFDDPSAAHCLPALGGFPGEMKNAYYSSIVFTIPSSIVVIRKEDLHKFPQKDGFVSFEKLMKSKLKGAKVKDGTYGVEVAGILKKYPNVMANRYTIDPASFFKMLVLKQLDYTLDYPYGFTYNLRSMRESDREKLTFLRIRENTPHIKAYALCSKNEAGKKAIQQINKCIRTQKHKKLVIQSIINYLPPSLSVMYKKLNESYIGTDH